MRKIAKRRSIRIAVIGSAGAVGAAAIAMLALPATAAVPTVTFKGGCAGVSASSTPDQDTITTQKSSASDTTAEVVVINRLNARGTPHANGKPLKWSDGKAVVVGKGDSVTVRLASGPVGLALVPDCSFLGVDTMLREEYQAVTVTVLAATQAETLAGSGTAAEPPTPDSGAGSADRKRPAAGARSATPGGSASPSTASPQAEEPAGDEAAAPLVPDGTGGDPQAAPLVPRNHTRTPVNIVLAVIATACLLGVAVVALRTLVFHRSASVGDI